ncbi:MAG TPA: tRNA dimethylallyltransferase, partial [Anaeromyxobacteraceae bacterium]
LALDLPRGELHARIDARLPRLFEGLLEEAGRLLAARGGALPPKLPIGYAEAAEVLLGRLEPAEALRRLRVSHRRYARRQVVWLRREAEVEWLSPNVDAGSLAGELARWRG